MITREGVKETIQGLILVALCYALAILARFAAM